MNVGRVRISPTLSAASIFIAMKISNLASGMSIGWLCFTASIYLKMKVARSSLMLVTNIITTWCHKPEDSNFKLHCHEIQKSCTATYIVFLIELVKFLV